MAYCLDVDNWPADLRPANLEQFHARIRAALDLDQGPRAGD
jgi:hypothetical protein